MQQLKLVRNVRLGVKNLLLHKMRSLLTTLGVVFGVASVVAMLSVGEGASQQALEQIRKLGSDTVIVSSKKPTEDDASGTMRVFLSIYGLLYDDEARIRESLPDVLQIAPAKHVRVEGRLGARSLDLRVVGTTRAWFDLVRRPLVAGRVLQDRDFAEKAPACVLTEAGARKLLATTAVIGETVELGRNAFEVVGIVRSEDRANPQMPMPDESVDAYVPLQVARERFGDTTVRRTSGSRSQERVELHQLIVQVASPEAVDEAGRAITAMLRRFHRKTDYDVAVPAALLRQAEATKRTFNVVLGSIAGISLLVGGIGIMNIMLASVTERTREIGLRRAIGAKRRQIVGQFLIETMVLSLVGGCIGIALGIAIPWAITRIAGMPTVVTAWSLLLSVGISIGIGVVFGLYPAVRASRLDPIVALRHD